MVHLPASVHPTSDEPVRIGPAALTGLVALVLLLANAAVTRPGLVVDQTVSGGVYGLILVLIALGLAIILGLLGIVNFAHGALFMLGAYVTFQVMAAWGLPFWAALVVVPILVGLVGVVIERGVLQFLYDENPLVGLLATFGIALMLTELTQAIWGGSPKSVEPPALFGGQVGLGVTSVPSFRLFIAAVCVLTVLAVYVLIERTSFGLSIRAGVIDREMAEFLGINIPLRFTLMFFLGAAIAGLGGLLRGTNVGMDLGMANQFLILAFVVVVVGGVGSLFGAVFAGLLIGWTSYLTPVILESLVQTVQTVMEAVGAFGVLEPLLPVTVLWGPDLVPDIVGLMPYLVMIAVLLIRPRGLFGREGFLE